MIKRYPFNFLANHKAFTLLEVLVAVSILAIAAVTLLASQRQNLAGFESVRSEFLLAHLAEQKLSELRGNPQSLETEEAGDFGPNYAGYRYLVKKVSFTRVGLEELDTIRDYVSMLEITIFAPGDKTRLKLQHAVFNEAALE
ncbi:MAG: prepilin-type N-terminal cleavage/methylation domain-containing protein [Desulfobulbaceae bacterium]|nr:MAG: prepilin-type N-terminal cleavage/methylation domain-containing protein [Desulfobulbaceae bacterium]